jgi:hypothetical protein
MKNGLHASRLQGCSPTAIRVISRIASSLQKLESEAMGFKNSGNELAYLKTKNKLDQICRVITLQAMVFEELNS